MAFLLSRPLELQGYDETGRPDFGLGSTTPAEASVPPSAAQESRYFVPTDAEMTTAAKTVAVNKFGGPCVYAGCKEYVAPGAGQRIKLRGSWFVRHLPNQCPAMKTLEPAVPATASTPADATGETAFAGYFTAQFGDDQDDYVTIRIRRQPEDSGFKPGQLVVGYLRGRSNETDYTKFAHIDGRGQARIWKSYAANTRLQAALSAVMGDQRAAGEAWARQSGRCWKCGRLLTTPESLDRLLGEECASKA
ncbi:DUF6011 domain-containing protein [Streptomyces yangpuensis]